MQQRSNLPLSFFPPTPSIRQDYAKLALITAAFVMMLFVGLLSAHAAMTLNLDDRRCGWEERQRQIGTLLHG